MADRSRFDHMVATIYDDASSRGHGGQVPVSTGMVPAWNGDMAFVILIHLSLLL